MDVTIQYERKNNDATEPLYYEKQIKKEILICFLILSTHILDYICQLPK